MPTASIALVRESNKRLSCHEQKNIVARSSGFSKDTINDMMKKAYQRLTR
jgi:hypothetical protein